ncbi:hypothetical protein GZH46_03032 [Fragariocoptes setiger]|uniref:Uncharacterized protein n=1 Tax=Fragariocoptes setiger TaxID=1670756 RepID=A0ABQ7S4X6_9ACAR|nr:hypothetical protein GZH46_03032 [Fragariocoptes setiger]
MSYKVPASVCLLVFVAHHVLAAAESPQTTPYSDDKMAPIRQAISLVNDQVNALSEYLDRVSRLSAEAQTSVNMGEPSVDFQACANLARTKRGIEQAPDGLDPFQPSVSPSPPQTPVTQDPLLSSPEQQPANSQAYRRAAALARLRLLREQLRQHLDAKTIQQIVTIALMVALFVYFGPVAVMASPTAGPSAKAMINTIMTQVAPALIALINSFVNGQQPGATNAVPPMATASDMAQPQSAATFQ